MSENLFPGLKADNTMKQMFIAAIILPTVFLPCFPQKIKEHQSIKLSDTLCKCYKQYRRTHRETESGHRLLGRRQTRFLKNCDRILRSEGWQHSCSSALKTDRTRSSERQVQQLQLQSQGARLHHLTTRIWLSGDARWACTSFPPRACSSDDKPNTYRCISMRDVPISERLFRCSFSMVMTDHGQALCCKYAQQPSTTCPGGSTSWSWLHLGFSERSNSNATIQSSHWLRGHWFSVRVRMKRGTKWTWWTRQKIKGVVPGRALGPASLHVTSCRSRVVSINMGRIISIMSSESQFRLIFYSFPNRSSCPSVI